MLASLRGGNAHSDDDRDEEADEEAVEEEAATKIQAAFRGHQARGRVRTPFLCREHVKAFQATKDSSCSRSRFVPSRRRRVLSMCATRPFFSKT